jgi:hypothetical protein
MQMVARSTAPAGAGGGGGSGSFEEMICFMREERQHMETKMEQHLDKLMQENTELREAARPKIASDLISEPQLEALQARLQGLSAAKLLSDEALYSLEDCIADCIEVMPSALAAVDAVDKVVRMVKLSEKMGVDSSFARQLQRKFTT